MLKSLVTEWLRRFRRRAGRGTSSVDIDWDSLYWGVWPRSRLRLIICKMGEGVGGQASATRSGFTRTSCYTEFVLKNVTITVEEDALRWARKQAAEENTSVSKLVGR